MTDQSLDAGQQTGGQTGGGAPRLRRRRRWRRVRRGGMFEPFLRDENTASHVRFVGVEAGGKGNSFQSAAALTRGSPGVLHGNRTYVLQVMPGESRCGWPLDLYLRGLFNA